MTAKVTYQCKGCGGESFEVVVHTENGKVSHIECDDCRRVYVP